MLHPAWAAIEASLLDATAREQLGDRRAADASIERALELAEPEGIILPFALAPVRELLERPRGHRTAHATLASTILDVLAGASPQSEASPLDELLSDAELRAVRYLPSNLKATEIAHELCVSPNTVRTHLRHIYAKLGVHTRAEAVIRARRNGLLAPLSRLRSGRRPPSILPPPGSGRRRSGDHPVVRRLEGGVVRVHHDPGDHRDHWTPA